MAAFERMPQSRGWDRQEKQAMPTVEARLSMKAMIALTVPEGKRLIAKAVAQMPEVARARESGKILLKGGTTVSAVAEELVGFPLRVSGRISPRGLKAADVVCDAPHSILIEGSQWRNVDSHLPEAVTRLGAGDAVVIGANIIDARGGAAMMAGTPLGGNPGTVMTGMMAEGVPIIVVAGLEKLIPGSVADAVRAAGRKGVDRSMGMAVGLMPIYGRVVTEVEAVRLLAPVECEVIGRGGIDGAEGGTALAIWGEAAAVERVFLLALELKGARTSGVPESMAECVGASSRCHGHLSCIYRSPALANARQV